MVTGYNWLWPVLISYVTDFNWSVTGPDQLIIINEQPSCSNMRWRVYLVTHHLSVARNASGTTSHKGQQEWAQGGCTRYGRQVFLLFDLLICVSTCSISHPHIFTQPPQPPLATWHVPITNEPTNTTIDATTMTRTMGQWGINEQRVSIQGTLPIFYHLISLLTLL